MTAIDPGRLSRTQELASLVDEAAEQYGVRVIVVAASDGVVLADSGIVIGGVPVSAVGEIYNEPGRPEIVDALTEGRSTSNIRRSEDLGQDIMATAVPILAEDGSIVGALRITQDVQDVTASVRRTTLGLLAIGAAGMLAGLVLAFALSGSLSRPLRRLAAAAGRLGSGDLSARAEEVGGANEIAELGRSFDDMAGRLQRTVQAQREFVANASHQLRTPLTGMKLRLESAIAQAGDDGVRRQLEAADREVDRLAEIVDRLLEMSRNIEEGEATRVDLDDAVARALARWEARAERAETRLRSLGRGGAAQANPSDLDQILDNLIDNAITHARGEVTIESRQTDGHALVTVSDRGPGIPEDELTRVTDRFYRGRSSSPGGSGLGLAIASDLAEKWGGSLTLTSAVGEGTRVEVRLRAIP